MALFKSNKTNEPTSRNAYAARGLVMVGFVLALLMLLNLSLKGAFTDTTTVSTTLDTAGGSIGPGSDVKVQGLVVGRVASISGDDTEVNLDLDLDNRMITGIPASVKARVLPASVFGTSFIDLTNPAGATDETLKAGAEIPQDLSQPTLELQAALDSVDKLVKALGPAELASALNSVSTALDGRGDDIGAALERADSLLARAQPLVPLAQRNLSLLAINMNTVERVAPDLLNAVDDALVVAGHLVEKRAQLTALLAGGTNLVQDTNVVLTENEARLVRSISGAARLTDALYDTRTGLRAGLLAVNNLTSKLPTLAKGGMVRVGGPIIQPVPYYTRADCPRYGSAPGKNCAGRAAPSKTVLAALAELSGRRGQR